MNGASPEVVAAIAFIVMSVAVGLGLLGLARVLTRLLHSKTKKKQGKYEAYECGVPLLGSARDRFGVKFYLVALLFVLFDVEAVFIFPWATRLEVYDVFGLVEMVVFIVVLSLGLVYAWRKGVLRWI